MNYEPIPEQDEEIAKAVIGAAIEVRSGNAFDFSQNLLNGIEHVAHVNQIILPHTAPLHYPECGPAIAD